MKYYLGDGNTSFLHVCQTSAKNTTTSASPSTAPCSDHHLTIQLSWHQLNGTSFPIGIAEHDITTQTIPAFAAPATAAGGDSEDEGREWRWSR